MKTAVLFTDFTYGRDTPTGGTRRYLELIYGLLDKGITVHLFVPQDAELQHGRNLIRHDIRTYSTPSFLVPNGLLNFVANARTLSSIRTIDYDAIILFDVPGSVQFRLLRLDKVCLLIRQDLIGYRQIHIGPATPIRNVYLAVLKRIERSVLLHAQRLAVQCEHDRDVLFRRHEKYVSLLEAKTIVLNNNVNPSWVEGNTRLSKGYKSGESLKLVFVGGLDDSRKGLSLLMDAVLTLLSEGENLSLDVIGGSQRLDHYRSQHSDRPSIRFWGALRDPLQVMRECDLLVVPSLADSFPNTILEAFSLELPVIGSAVGGIPEMLRHEDLTFAPNATDLAAKLRRILRDERLDSYREYSRGRKKELTFDWVGRVCDWARL